MSDSSQHSIQNYEANRYTLAFLWSVCGRAGRQWAVWVPAFAIAVTVAYFTPRVVPPMFESHSVLMFRETIAKEVVQFGGNNRFRETWRERSSRYVDLAMARSNLSQIISIHNLYPDQVRSDGMVAAVLELRRRIQIDSGNQNVIMLRFSHEDPKLALAVLQDIESSLKKQPADDAANTAKATLEFLERHLETIDADLTEKEAVLAGFLAENPQFAMEPSTSAQLGASIRSEQNKPAPTGKYRLGALLQQEERLVKLLESPASSPARQERPPPSLSAADQAKIEEAQAKVAEATQRLRSLKAEFTAAHPDVVEASQTLGKAQARLTQVKAAAVPVSAPLPPPSPEDPAGTQRLQDQLKIVRARIEAARGDVETEGSSSGSADWEDTVTLETRYITMSRDADAAREYHGAVSRKMFEAQTEARLKSAGGDGEIVTIDEPFLPTRPTRRGPLRTSSLAFALLMGLGGVVAVGLVLADKRVYGEHDLAGLQLGPTFEAIQLPAVKGEQRGDA
ncbi:MAG: protein kinase involved in polysaccharide biosynthesis [Pseudomonadota bacterium]|jgi:uncharacterized protein involved in exopolysaccharide biosynthesis